jgi:hypothetical protein
MILYPEKEIMVYECCVCGEKINFAKAGYIFVDGKWTCENCIDKGGKR